MFLTADPPPHHDWVYILMTLLKGTGNIVLSVTLDQLSSPPSMLMILKNNRGRYQGRHAKIKVARVVF